jgi:D-alanine-D-alanine ligase
LLRVLIVYDIDHSWDKEEIRETRDSNRILFEALREEGLEAYLEELSDPHLERILDRHDPRHTIVFNLCEALPGTAYPERRVTEILEKRGSPTPATNRRSLISVMTSRRQRSFSHHLVCLFRTSCLRADEAHRWNLFPAIVKPSREHCSLTITEKSVVFDTNSLREQIMLVNNELNQPALVEDFIDGREFHVSVWNNGPPEILPVAEMDFLLSMKQERGSVHMIQSSFRAPDIMRESKPWCLLRSMTGFTKGLRKKPLTPGRVRVH